MAREWMKEAREKSGKTQREAATALNISESYYCEIENGNRMPRLDLRFADDLSKLFKVPLKRILDAESNVSV